MEARPKEVDELWFSYYNSEGNRRHFPDEDVCRFLSWTRQRWVSLGKFFLAEMRIHILDFGCGDGRNATAIKHFFPKSVLLGVDFAYNNIALNRRKLYDAFLTINEWENLDYQEEASGQDQPVVPKKTQFDIVIDCLTSQHLPWRDHEECYRNISRKLPPYGSFFLKHLDSNCTDTKIGVRDESDIYTYHNVPNVAEACFPDNKTVCMPPSEILAELLLECGLTPRELLHLSNIHGTIDRRLIRGFSHVAAFCMKT